MWDSPATQEAIAVTYAQGMAACRRGEPLDNNPYDPEGQTGRLYTAWSKGWRKEQCSS
jgi:hypothetical protein